jgi:hypothetical protein
MYPVETPQAVRRQMDWQFGFPVLVNIVAKLFNLFWNLVRTDWLVFAAADFNAGWTKVPSVRADAIKRDRCKCSRCDGRNLNGLSGCKK